MKQKLRRKTAVISEYEHFHDGGPYHIETSTLIYVGNQWTGFYTTSWKNIFNSFILSTNHGGGGHRVAPVFKISGSSAVKCNFLQ